jgi:myo-inositol-1(or 4)-monophosphatase
MIEVFRSIGARLRAELKGYEPGGSSVYAQQASLPRGAGGDRTFPLDRRAEEIVIEGLDATGLPLTIVSEEAGIVELRGGGPRVVVDPIDGSKNAITGIPYFGLSLARAEGATLDTATHAYILNLASGEEFHAERGGGAYRNGRPIRAQGDAVWYLTAYETQTPGHDLPLILPLLAKARRTRCMGAIALDLAYLAAGAVSVLVSPVRTRSFDLAAGWLIAREAGALVTDFTGRDLGYAILDMKRIAPVMGAANRGLLDEALALLPNSYR